MGRDTLLHPKAMKGANSTLQYLVPHAPRVPERKQLDGGRGLVEHVVEVVARSSQQHAPHASKNRMVDGLTRSGKLGDEAQRVVQIFRKGQRRLVAIMQPPFGCVANMTSRSAGRPEPVAHSPACALIS